MFDFEKLGAITDFLVIVIEILVTIGLTIFVHELGHFLTAKRLGVKVEKFAIGWGPKIVSFKHKDTEYIIALFVFLGGYVKMAGEAPEEAAAAGEGGFLNQPAWKKILISVAGVVQNAIFALFLMWIVFLAGSEVLKPVIDEVKKGYPAYQSGLLRGDEIVKINNEKIKYWSQITDAILKTKGEVVNVVALRNGKEMNFAIKPVMEESEDILQEKKLRPFLGITPIAFIPVVESLKDGYPAQSAGIKAGDTISEINGKKIIYWDDITDAVKASSKKVISVKVIRGKETKVFEMMPRREMIEDQDKKKTETFLIGIAPKGNTIIESYDPLTAFGKASQQTWNFTELTVKSLYKMITRKIKPDVAGPIGVAQIAYKVAKTGFVNLLLLIAIININLALFNLLPLVPFDGGMIFLFLIEGITRKKVPQRIQQLMMEIGWALVILLIVFVTYSDIMRIVKGG
ncbi:MAG: RIP metalloprotease RseP [bacterium]